MLDFCKNFLRSNFVNITKNGNRSDNRDNSVDSGDKKGIFLTIINPRVKRRVRNYSSIGCLGSFLPFSVI